MAKGRIHYAPFNAINEFMLPDFRQSVIQEVLGKMDSLAQERRKTLIGLIQKTVTIPGFRNAALAPLMLKVKGAVKSFEKNPQFVGQLLAAWSELKPELRQQVYELLKARNWEVLPIEMDRNRLPGFLISWQKGEDYEVLDAAFAASYPEVKINANDMRLMVVWIGGRLPYNAAEEGEDEG